MTIPAFQFWRLRVTSIEAGDLLKIDSMAFLGRSGGDNIATGGTALSDAGDASGAFTGGSAWRVGFGGDSAESYVVGTETGSPPKGLEVYNADTDELIDSIYAGTPSALAPINAQYDPQKRWIATVYTAIGVATAPRFKSFNASTLALVASIFQGPGDTRYNRALRFNHDGSYFGDAYEVRRTTDWLAVFYLTLDGNIGIVYDVAFSPDGNYFAVAYDDSGNSPYIRVYDTSTWLPIVLSITNTPTSIVTSCDFSPDGTILKISCDAFTSSVDTIINIDTSTWTEIDYFQVQDATAIEKIRHSNSGQYLAITSSGGTASTIMPVDVYDVSASPPSRVPITSSLPNFVESTAAPAWRDDDSEILVPIDNLSTEITDRLFRVDTSTWEISAALSGNREYYSADYSPSFPAGSWIGYKFAYPVTPTHIDITASGDSRPRSGVVEYSPDGRTWYALQTIAFS